MRHLNQVNALHRTFQQYRLGFHPKPMISVITAYFGNLQQENLRIYMKLALTHHAGSYQPLRVV